MQFQLRDLKDIVQWLDESPDDKGMDSILARENFGVYEKETESGKSLLHVAAELMNTKVVDFLLRRRADPLAKDSDGYYPIIRSVTFNDVATLKVFDEFDENLLNVKISSPTVTEEIPLVRVAIVYGAKEAMEYLVSRNRDCVNQVYRGNSLVQLLCSKLRSGDHGPLEYEIPENQAKVKPAKRSKADQKEKKTGTKVVEDPKAKSIKEMITLVLENCSKDILIIEKSVSVLPNLIQIGHFKGIKLIYQRFNEEKDFLKTFTNSLDSKKQPPIGAVVRIANHINDDIVDLFRLFLDHEADLESAFEAAIEVSELRLFQVALERCHEEEGNDRVRLSKTKTFCDSAKA